ncbi:hypothetical protein ABK040_015350 [Willaertia magna]
MSNALTENEFREAFSLYDNGNGTITSDKLNHVLRTLGLSYSDKDLEELTNILDSSHSGQIHSNSFVNEMKNRCKSNDNQNIDEYLDSFRIFDKDQDGFISTEELRHIMTTMGERLTNEEVEDLVREVDPQGKGSIHYESFIKMCLQN